MKLVTLLSVLAVATLRSDIARVYANGKELAIGNQTGGMPEVNGKEKAMAVNGSLSVDHHDDRTK